MKSKPTIELPTRIYRELAEQARREGKTVSQVLDEEIRKALDAARLEWS